ncbi:MAG: hypothetical protein EZS28_005045 [Streblomastix strix]|uniref:SP-RING-type domain-containing protein n=1 Tax=Streblomastix strix TaxID=222440 RepID=A0A5J4WY71_9EUKA|nr:MAG: hypothetical protein EZS28_005045 [Streblomastix strix]
MQSPNFENKWKKQDNKTNKDENKNQSNEKSLKNGSFEQSGDLKRRKITVPSSFSPIQNDKKTNNLPKPVLFEETLLKAIPKNQAQPVPKPKVTIPNKISLPQLVPLFDSDSDEETEDMTNEYSSSSEPFEQENKIEPISVGDETGKNQQIKQDLFFYHYLDVRVATRIMRFLYEQPNVIQMGLEVKKGLSHQDLKAPYPLYKGDRVMLCLVHKNRLNDAVQWRFNEAGRQGNKSQNKSSNQLNDINFKQKEKDLKNGKDLKDSNNNQDMINALEYYWRKKQYIQVISLLRDGKILEKDEIRTQVDDDITGMSGFDENEIIQGIKHIRKKESVQSIVAKMFDADNEQQKQSTIARIASQNQSKMRKKSRRLIVWRRRRSKLQKELSHIKRKFDEKESERSSEIEQRKQNKERKKQERKYQQDKEKDKEIKVDIPFSPLASKSIQNNLSQFMTDENEEEEEDQWGWGMDSNQQLNDISLYPDITSSSSTSSSSSSSSSETDFTFTSPTSFHQSLLPTSQASSPSIMQQSVFQSEFIFNNTPFHTPQLSPSLSPSSPSSIISDSDSDSDIDSSQQESQSSSNDKSNSHSHSHSHSKQHSPKQKKKSNPNKQQSHHQTSITPSLSSSSSSSQSSSPSEWSWTYLSSMVSNDDDIGVDDDEYEQGVFDIRMLGDGIKDTDGQDQIDGINQIDKNNLDKKGCPITFTRMHIPGRGVKCTHLACFDLGAFLTQSAPTRDFRCPHCRKYIPPQDLRIDDLFQSLLSRRKKVKKKRSGIQQLNKQANQNNRNQAFSDLYDDEDDDEDDEEDDDGEGDRAIFVPRRERKEKKKKKMMMKDEKIKNKGNDKQKKRKEKKKEKTKEKESQKQEMQKDDNQNEQNDASNGLNSSSSSSSIDNIISHKQERAKRASEREQKRQERKQKTLKTINLLEKQIMHISIGIERMEDIQKEQEEKQRQMNKSEMEEIVDTLYERLFFTTLIEKEGENIVEQLSKQRKQKRERRRKKRRIEWGIEQPTIEQDEDQVQNQDNNGDGLNSDGMNQKGNNESIDLSNEDKKNSSKIENLTSPSLKQTSFSASLKQSSKSNQSKPVIINLDSDEDEEDQDESNSEQVQEQKQLQQQRQGQGYGQQQKECLEY